MFKYVLLFIAAAGVHFMSCKNNKEVDPLLKDAILIQDEGIHIGMEVDSILTVRMSQGIYQQDIEKLRAWKIFTETWKANMVEVPGIEHDHDHHDHHGHNHNHEHHHTGTADHLTPAEVKKVQEDWRSAIMAIRDSLKQQ